MKLNFTTLDVFTSTRYAGNPLAIVSLPAGTDITPEQKHMIAREFNLSETVFAYLPENEEDAAEVKISIYTTTQELPFAGHPTVGSAFFLLGLLNVSARNETVLDTLSGKIPISYDASTSLASVRVAHDVLVHKPYVDVLRVATTLGLSASDVVQLGEGGVGLASIVKGMSFLLVELKDLEALGRARPTGGIIAIEGTGERDAERDWLVGFIGLYCFVRLGGEAVGGTKLEVRKIRARMIYEGLREDPATGSAGCALSAWMSLADQSQADGEEEQRYEIVQGVEMGQRSEIVVNVRAGKQGIREVRLEGRSVKIMEGVLDI